MDTLRNIMKQDHPLARYCIALWKAQGAERIEQMGVLRYNGRAKRNRRQRSKGGLQWKKSQ